MILRNATQRNATPKPLLALVFAAVSLCAAPSYAQTDAQLMASGQWRDPATGLIWMRCSIGQTWTGNTCTGEPLKLNWQDANDYFELFNQDGFAGRKNWRLPNIVELNGLRRCSTGWSRLVKTIGNLTKDLGVEKRALHGGNSYPASCANNSSQPTIDTEIFPNTPYVGAAWWSSSTSVESKNQACGVEFRYGTSGHSDKTEHIFVRAVRASQ